MPSYNGKTTARQQIIQSRIKNSSPFQTPAPERHPNGKPKLFVVISTFASLKLEADGRIPTSHHNPNRKDVVAAHRPIRMGTLARSRCN